jgi:Fe2+ transport system protein FeoA
MNTLAQAQSGTTVRIQQLNTHPETCHRLRELGFCENAIVRCVTNGSAQLICEVCNTRVGLNHSVAKTIIVTTFE